VPNETPQSGGPKIPKSELVNMPDAQPPIIISDPKLGTIRLLGSFREDVRDLFEHLIAEEDMRCIWRDGHAYIAWDDVAPYTHEDEWDVDSISPKLSDEAQLKDPLSEAIEQQGKSDDAVLRAKTRLFAVTTRLRETAATNPFAHALQWHGFWIDAAVVAANFAGETEAASMRNALTQISDRAADGANSSGVQAFHKALLSLADLTLEQRFAEIWSNGGVRWPNDPEKQQLALAALAQLTTMFNGGRGEPEGADSPRRAMTRYMSVVSLAQRA